MRIPVITVLLLAACSTSPQSAEDILLLDAPETAAGTDAPAAADIGAEGVAEEVNVPLAPEWPAEPVSAQVLLADLPAATEGLAFDDQGRLYLGTTKGEVLRTGPDLSVSVFATLLPLPEGATEGTAGLAVGPDQALYVCRYDAGRIERIALNDPADIAVHLEIETPNSLVFRPGGDLWFTSSGGHSDWDGHIGRLKAGAELPEVVVNHVTYANGLAFAPDGTSLYVTSSDPGQLWRIPLDANGNPGEAEVLADGPEMAIADGLLMAPDGTLLIAGFGTGKVYRWRDGTLLELVVPGEGENYFGTASLAFGRGNGFSETTLYFTNLVSPVVRMAKLGLATE